MKKTALVIFKKVLSERERSSLMSATRYDVVISPAELREEITEFGNQWFALEDFVEAGSIYEANALVEELSRLELPDKSLLAKSFIYKGYELWWINYDTLFFLYCLPYTQYRRLLTYLKDFQDIQFYHPPYLRLFACYLSAYDCRVGEVRERGLKRLPFLPFGVFIQIILTIIFLPILVIQRRSAMVFISDEFDTSRDYHFRMRFIYEELRGRELPFVEFIRSIEPWKTVLKHALHRKRPVIYTDAIAFIARFISFLTGGRRRAKKLFGPHIFALEENKEAKFKALLATQYLLCVYDDVWAIRITKFILWLIGVRSALIVAAMGRNFHSVIGCKLNSIPVIGILHGVASQHYNVYDFMPNYDGEKTLSVDKYGLWSKWWREYYLQYSRVYTEDQLYISGPMRPRIREEVTHNKQRNFGKPVKVLFVSEQLAVPEEVLPYLEALIENKDVSLYIVFRPYLDGFGTWLERHHPEILKKIGDNRIFKNGIKEALPVCDVVVGTHSTAVLESLLELKPMVFFATHKWGDYFDLKGFDSRYTFFAESPEELLAGVRKGQDVPVEVLQTLQERFFGDPYQNGSKWAVDEVENAIHAKGADFPSQQ